jgi:hypothetical protein
MHAKSLLAVLALVLAMNPPIQAAPRDNDWKKVVEAMEKDQPKTAGELLQAIETAALADQAWGEATRAIAQRIALEGRVEGGPAAALKRLEARIADAPGPARPLLAALSAHWLHSYYQQNRWRFARRSATAEQPGEDIETWDLGRILAEIDKRFQAVLEAAPALQAEPVAAYAKLLTDGNPLGDSLRPTLYDFICHDALSYYASEEVAVSRPQGAFEIDAAESPVFAASAEFLAWQPQTSDTASPKLRALRIWQSLLAFHREDADRSAFLHCDLERLRWAAQAATGPARNERRDAALAAFIAANAAHPISAEARREVAGHLLEAGKPAAAHAMAKAGADAFPGHPFGKLCANFTADLEERRLNLRTESHWTPAGAVINVSHRNVNRVWLRAYPRPWSPAEAMRRGELTPEGPEKLAALLKEKPALEWDAPLPDDKNFADRETTLAAPDGLKPGFHLIVASGDPAFAIRDNSIAVAAVHVTDLALALRARDGEFGGIVTDARSGAPLEGIGVGFWMERNRLPGVRSETTKTDAAGLFALKPGGEHGQILVVALRDGNRAVAGTWHHPGGRERPSEARESVVFFTDRAIYRPGQTIHFKGIKCRTHAQKGDYQTVAKSPVKVVLRDPNGKEIETLDLQTNERGSFAASFTAPSGSVLGMFRIEARGLGTTAVRVEEYKRPKFFTEIKAPAAAAALGQRVEVTGMAEAYTGAAVDGAKVEWRVKRATRWPVWIRWCWWFVPPTGEEQEIANGTAVTAADGSYQIAFTAAPDKALDPETEPVFDFIVTAAVTDPAGETREATRVVSVAYTTVRASLGAPAWLAADGEFALKARVESHDGEPRPAEGVVRVFKLRGPETCPRPAPGGGYRPQPAARDAAGDPASPDPNQWPLGEVVRELPFNIGESGEIELPLALPAGWFRAVLETTDTNGRKVQALLGLECVDPRAERFPVKIPFFTGTPKAALEPGETFTLVWGSGYAEARALVEWFKDGKLMKREWSAAGRTQQAFSWSVDEPLRGGFTVRVSQFTMNVQAGETRVVQVPWTNKKLALSWERITSKLEPGAKETWTAVIKGPDGEAAAAEMVATLYDASLDAFVPHRFPGLAGQFRNEHGVWWRVQFSNQEAGFNGYAGWEGGGRFGMDELFRSFVPEVDPFGGGLHGMFALGGGFGGGGARGLRMRNGAAMAMPMVAEAAGMDAFAASDAAPPAPGAPVGAVAKSAEVGDPFGGEREEEEGEAAPGPDLSQVSARANLQETAFFFPHLASEADGTVRMTFTMPEALTRWKFLGFAHDPALRSGFLEGETVTAKDLMVQPNPPRFLREGDTLEFTVRITNQSDQEQTGKAALTLADAAGGADLTAALGISAPEQAFSVPAKESRTLSWRLSVPDGAGFLRYKAVAASGALADGEEGWLPVIPRRILVTESLALPIRNAGEKNFTFQKLLDSGKSDTLQSKFLHVQVVSQPAWYAVMALPYLMEFPHECAEQLFNRYYANALASHIARSDPKIARIFEQWKGTDALDSPLMKNADLKGILLEETPWLREAGDEAAARRRVALLFDENSIGEQLERALAKLNGMQNHDGRWPWFPGGPGNEFISLYIATGFGRLRALGVETDISPALKALPALDRALTERYQELKKAKRLDEDNLSPWIAHHLYTRSFFLKDRAVGRGDKEAFDYFAGQARKHWPSLGSRMARAHAALALHRLGDKEMPRLVTTSFKQNAVTSEELGMWWKDARAGWWWWEAPIETQAMMIEAFREIDGDGQAVDDCQVWLLKQKQVQDWKTTKATADAIYALLLGGRNLLGSDALLEIALGGETVRPAKVEAGTGFYEVRFPGPEVKPAFGNITLKKSDPGVSWASVHWQYLEDMARVTAHNETPLTLEKALFVRRNTPAGPQLEAVKGPLKVGDELVTRVVLRSDRAMEFVHLKDLRGSGTEPVNVLSGYRWQDGFGYYEVTRDTASHFFLDSLPAGTHVFESSTRIQHAGRYQTGTAEIRCMYAPEFNAHSNSVEIVVER